MANQDFVLNESSTALRSSIIESVLFAYCIIGILGYDSSDNNASLPLFLAYRCLE
jgi:hypothetical protein